MNRKRLTLTILLILMAAPLAMLTYADDSEPEVETEKVVDDAVVEKLFNWCSELSPFFDDLEDIEFPPDVINQLAHAEEAFKEGQDFELGDQANEAAQSYWRAMIHFRNALRKLQKNGFEYEGLSIPDKRNEDFDDPLALPPPEVIQSTKLQLMTQFEANWRQRIENLEQLINESEDLSDEDIAKLQAMILRTVEKLERMKLKLGEGDVEGAFQEAGEGNEDFDETLEGLDDKEAGKMLKEMNKLEAKLQKMQQSMEHRRNKGEDIDPEEEDLLNQANGKLKNAKDNFKNGNKKGAQDDLDGAGDDLKGNKGKGQDKDKGDKTNGKDK